MTPPTNLRGVAATHWQFLFAMSFDGNCSVLGRSTNKVTEVGETRDSLIGVFDFAWDRLGSRLKGLGDAEYLWEPVADCWSIRMSDSGTWIMDDASASDAPPPMTTIAWRTCHLGGHVLGGFANWLNSDGESPYNVDFIIPNDATGAKSFLELNYEHWRRGMDSFPEERLWLPIGSEFGPFAESSAVDLILHVLDEFIHHAAEIALLRDLYLRLG